MNKAVVITSIFPPTKAVKLYADNPDIVVIVVGDKKTPGYWSCPGVRYLGVSDQIKSQFRVNAALPFNHYSRKMLGYLEAIAGNAEVIVDTDDDNLPKQNWGYPNFEALYETVDSPTGFINTYQFFTSHSVWPRGLPLNLIQTDFDAVRPLKRKFSRVGIWQGLADEDPDVDAIYRLTNNTPICFENREPIVLAKGVASPFNSQNTCFRKECFPLLYLPVSVSFRFTDILRSFVAQPILWSMGYTLGFHQATVVQQRNPHDYMKDFESEVLMYLKSEVIFQVVNEAVSERKSIFDNLHSAYHSLCREGIVSTHELETLDHWLADVDCLC